MPEHGILRVEGLTKSFGGIRAVAGLDFSVAPREIVGLIGPNGAGKTTVFNLVTGVYKPDRGRVEFLGEDVTGMAAHSVVRKGIARTFQNIRLFNNLTVLDNVKTALHAEPRYHFVDALFRTGRVKAEDQAVRERAAEYLAMVGLSGVADLRAGNLPYGMARKLEIARALALKPRLLLLDEPAAGMNPEEIRSLGDLILKLYERFELTIILIEHRMDLVMSICPRIVVLNFGEKLAEGGPEDIQSDQGVLQAYLGEEYRNAQGR